MATGTPNLSNSLHKNSASWSLMISDTADMRESKFSTLLSVVANSSLVWRSDSQSSQSFWKSASANKIMEIYLSLVLKIGKASNRSGKYFISSPSNVLDHITSGQI